MNESRATMTYSDGSHSRKDVLSRVVSCLLGVFFIVSGIGKLLNVSALVGTLGAYGFPPRLSYVAALIPPVEILLGTGLFLFVRSRQLALVSVGLLLSFTIAFSYAHFARGIDDCGCFGELTFLSTSPLLSLLRNATLIAASAFLWRYPASSRVRYDTWQMAFLLVSGVVLFTISGMSSVRPLYVTGASPRASLVNRPVSSTPLASLGAMSPDSTYLVFVFSTTCPHCWNSVENVKAFQRTRTVDRVIGISASSDSALAEFKARFEPNFPIYHVDASQLGLLTDAVPTALFVRDGAFFHVEKGTIDAPYTYATRIGARVDHQGIR